MQFFSAPFPHSLHQPFSSIHGHHPLYLISSFVLRLESLTPALGVRFCAAVSYGFFSSAIKACAAQGRWEEALELLEEMENDGLKPNLITYTGGRLKGVHSTYGRVNETLYWRTYTTFSAC